MTSEQVVTWDEAFFWMGMDDTTDRSAYEH